MKAIRQPLAVLAALFPAAAWSHPGHVHVGAHGPDMLSGVGAFAVALSIVWAIGLLARRSGGRNDM